RHSAQESLTLVYQAGSSGSVSDGQFGDGTFLQVESDGIGVDRNRFAGSRPVQEVPSGVGGLADNTVAGTAAVTVVVNGELKAGSATWPVLAGVSGIEVSSVTVDSGASLAIAPNVAIAVGKIDDFGTLSASHASITGGLFLVRNAARA